MQPLHAKTWCSDPPVPNLEQTLTESQALPKLVPTEFTDSGMQGGQVQSVESCKSMLRPESLHCSDFAREFRERSPSFRSCGNDSDHETLGGRQLSSRQCSAAWFFDGRRRKICTQTHQSAKAAASGSLSQILSSFPTPAHPCADDKDGKGKDRQFGTRPHQFQSGIGTKADKACNGKVCTKGRQEADGCAHHRGDKSDETGETPWVTSDSNAPHEKSFPKCLQSGKQDANSDGDGWRPHAHRVLRELLDWDREEAAACRKHQKIERSPDGTPTQQEELYDEASGVPSIPSQRGETNLEALVDASCPAVMAFQALEDRCAQGPNAKAGQTDARVFGNHDPDAPWEPSCPNCLQDTVPDTAPDGDEWRVHAHRVLWELLSVDSEEHKADAS